MINVPFFSIIIPLYNAEKFLNLTLKSILLQSFNDYELILIDDGSTDKSKEICCRYAKSDKRIVFISKINEGVSIARNYGLDIAKGKYVFFVDADDIVYENALYNIYNEIITHTDIDYLRFEYKIIDTEGKKLYTNYQEKKRISIENNILNSSECLNKIIRNEFFLWSGIFRKSIIENFNLRFMKGCTYNEDTLFMINFFRYSKKHLYISKTLYGYRKYENAVTAGFTEKNYNDVKTIFIKLCYIYNEVNGDFKVSLKNVIEKIGLRIYSQKKYFNKNNIEEKQVIELCSKSPITLEWKLISCLGIENAEKLFPLIIIIRKIIRKLF